MKKFSFIAMVACLCLTMVTGEAFAEKKQKKVAEVTFATYLHCENCKKKVQENIAFEKGVKSLDVSLEQQTINIGYDPDKTDIDKLAAAIRKLGYKAEIWDGTTAVEKDCGECCDGHEHEAEHTHK